MTNTLDLPCLVDESISFPDGFEEGLTVREIEQVFGVSHFPEVEETGSSLITIS